MANSWQDSTTYDAGLYRCCQVSCICSYNGSITCALLSPCATSVSVFKYLEVVTRSEPKAHLSRLLAPLTRFGLACCSSKGTACEQHLTVQAPPSSKHSTPSTNSYRVLLLTSGENLFFLQATIFLPNSQIIVELSNCQHEPRVVGCGLNPLSFLLALTRSSES